MATLVQTTSPQAPSSETPTFFIFKVSFLRYPLRHINPLHIHKGQRPKCTVLSLSSFTIQYVWAMVSYQCTEIFLI